MLARDRGEPVDQHALGQFDPHEVAALRRGEPRLGQLPAQRGDQGVAPLAQGRPHHADRPVEQAGAAVLVDDRLGHHVRRDVGVGGQLDDLRQHLLRADQVAAAQAGRDRLGERRRVDHGVGGVLGQHGGQRLALEPDRHVGVVLEHDEAVLGGERQQLGALGRAERVAGRVLEVGDDVRQRGPHPTVHQGPQRGHVDAVGLQVDRVHGGAALPQAEQGAVVGGGLDHHVVAWPHQRLEQEGVGLHGPVGHQHLVHVHAVLLRDPLAQRQVAAGRAVAERAGRVGAERFLRRLGQPLGVDDVQRRGAAGERDQRIRGHGRERITSTAGRARELCRPAVPPRFTSSAPPGFSGSGWSRAACAPASRGAHGVEPGDQAALDAHRHHGVDLPVPPQHQRRVAVDLRRPQGRRGDPGQHRGHARRQTPDPPGL